MFSDKTARWAAHEKYGERNYGWLMALKAAPWVLFLTGACWMWGSGSVAHTLGAAFRWLFGSSAERTAVMLAFLGFCGLAIKARWRRIDRG